MMPLVTTLITTVYDSLSLFMTPIMTLIVDIILCALIMDPMTSNQIRYLIRRILGKL
jgi:hypothetical protein